MKKQIKYLMLVMIIGCYLSTNAQEVVSGRIATESGEFITGANVSVFAGAVSAVSDGTGNFSFRLANGKYTLRISKLGFDTIAREITMPLMAPLELVMRERINNLEQFVIHTGYQKLNKRSAVGSFTELSAKELDRQFSVNILSRLEAVANGVSVDRRSNSEGNLMVRGLSTINGNRQPLIILDNFPYLGDFDNINPNDIASITILKDAAATAIWGARAGNGVIVLTSKQGLTNKALAVNLATNLSLAQKPDLFYLNQLNSSDFIALEKELYARGFYASSINSTDRPALSPVVELLLARDKGTMSSENLVIALNKLSSKDIRKELLNTNYQKPFSQQYYLSLSAANDKLNWFLSAGLDRGVAELGAQNNRLSLNFKSEFKISPKFTLSWQGIYTSSLAKAGRAGYADLANGNSMMFPYLSLKDEDGKAVAVAKNYSLSYLNSLNGYLDWNYYPLNDHLNTDLSSMVGDLLGNVGLNYNVVKGLDFSVQYRYQQQNNKERKLYTKESYFARDFINLYTSIQGAVSQYNVPLGGILSQTLTSLTSQQLRGQINGSKLLAQHEFTGIIGAEVSDQHTTAFTDQRYGYDEQTLAYDFIDFTRPYPNSITGFANYIFPGNIDLSELRYRFVSLYGNGNYNFKKRYFFQGSLRRDASNVFGLASNDKWKPLWSVGAAWIVSEEPFYKFKPINYLKLRASFGFSGNVDQSKSALVTIRSNGTSPYTGSNSARFNNYSNPDLRWEQVATINAGIDFSLINSRLSGSIDVYEKKSTDLYGAALVDYTSIPATTIVKNVASIKANGLDLNLNANNLVGVFKWNTHVNLSLYKDKVLDYYLSNPSPTNFVNSGSSAALLIGYPVYGLFSYRFAGLDPLNGNPLGFEKGQRSSNYTNLIGSTISLADLKYHGSVFPTIFGTVGNQFKFNNFGLDVQLTYKLGYYFRRQGIDYSNLYNRGIGHNDYQLRWQNPGDELTTQVPSSNFSVDNSRDRFYTMSDILVERGDHVRLAFLNLTYIFSEAKIGNIGLKNLQLSAGASNLGMLWSKNKLGLDPDYQIGSIPPAKIFSFGIKANY